MKKFIAIATIILAAFTTTAFAETYQGTMTIQKKVKNPETATAERDAINRAGGEIRIVSEEEFEEAAKKEREEKTRREKERQEKERVEKEQQKADNDKKVEAKKEKKQKKTKKEKRKVESVSGTVGGNILGKIFGK